MLAGTVSIVNPG